MKIKWTSFLMLISIQFIWLGCASKLVVQTEPNQADVFLSVDGKSEKIKAGQSPLELTETQINELLKIESEKSHWIKMTIEKKDHVTKEFMLPSNRWGEQTKNIKVILPTLDDTSTTVKKVLKYFFNAKKFAETKQYEQAHIEIDRVLEIDSSMVQALSMKAGIFFLQGNFEESRQLYRKAIDIDPGFNDAVQMLEKIKLKTGAG